MFSSGSRGFRILDPTVDRAHQLLNERPGSVAMRLEEAVELLPDEGGPDLLVMELATGGERTIDGIANGSEIVLGHPKTREAMRAGLAMYFVTLDDPELMRVGNLIVAELGIEHFFNIQLVGDYVIEINPRISTIVYQEDLNIPYLGVKRAIGEISDDELRTYASRIRPGRTALRYFDQLEFDVMTSRRAVSQGRCPRDMTLRVTHCPVNIAGIPWENVQALRRKGVDARLVVFERGRAPPRGRLVARPPRPAAAAARAAVRGVRAARAADGHLPLLLRADADPEVAAVPAPARAAQEERLPLPRLRHPRQVARGARVRQARRRRDRRLLRRDPLGARGARDPARARPAPFTPVPPSDNPRPLVVHAPSNREKKGTRYVIEACEQLPSSSTSSRASRTTWRASATRAPTSSSTS